MTVYAIGDVQGCYEPLARLVDELGFDPAEDQLWFAGDLVNRGPQSLEVLRFVRSLGDSAVVVLGNHDLHLLALAISTAKKPRRTDTLRTVLDAPDAGELIDWLRHRPVMHENANTMMVHAGVPPSWTPDITRHCAADLTALLISDDAGEFLASLYGHVSTHWGAADTPRRRNKFACAALTRIRFATTDGRLDFLDKGAPGSQRSNLRPWFEMLDETWDRQRIVFGHWAALGRVEAPGYVCLDSGCVWGRTLSAVRIDARRDTKLTWYAVPCEAKESR